MTYVSFITLCLKLYSLPSNWTYGMTLLRHILGLVSMLQHKLGLKVLTQLFT